MFFRKKEKNPAKNQLLENKIAIKFLVEENRALVAESLAKGSDFHLLIRVTIKNFFEALGVAFGASSAFHFSNNAMDLISYAENEFLSNFNQSSSPILSEFIQTYPFSFKMFLTGSTFAVGLAVKYSIVDQAFFYMTQEHTNKLLQEYDSLAETRLEQKKDDEENLLKELTALNKTFAKKFETTSSALSSLSVLAALSTFVLAQTFHNKEYIVDALLYFRGTDSFDEYETARVNSTLKEITIDLYLLTLYFLVTHLINGLIHSESKKQRRLDNQLIEKQTWLETAITAPFEFKIKKGRFVKTSCFAITLNLKNERQIADVINLLKKRFSENNIIVLDSKNNKITVSADFVCDKNLAKSIAKELNDILDQEIEIKNFKKQVKKSAKAMSIDLVSLSEDPDHPSKCQFLAHKTHDENMTNTLNKLLEVFPDLTIVEQKTGTSFLLSGSKPCDDELLFEVFLNQFKKVAKGQTDNSGAIPAFETEDAQTTVKKVRKSKEEEDDTVKKPKHRSSAKNERYRWQNDLALLAKKAPRKDEDKPGNALNIRKAKKG